MSVAIALQNPKTPENIASILRLAVCWEVDAVLIVGVRAPTLRRAHKHPLNTHSGEKHCPVLHFDSWAELAAAWPTHWTPVGVELSPQAEDIRSFKHPRNALYCFGPEDGNLQTKPLALRHTVVIPTKACLNLAHAVGVTLYARSLNRSEREG